MFNSKIIKDFYGARIGELQTDARGNINAYDRFGAMLGTYNPRTNVTTEFPSGRIVSTGDTTTALIWQKENERKAQFNKNNH